MNELMLRDLLVFHGVHIVEGAALESVDAKGVYYEVEGVPALAEGDTVITAVGMEANHALFDAAMTMRPCSRSATAAVCATSSAPSGMATRRHAVCNCDPNTFARAGSTCPGVVLASGGCA